MDDVLILGLTLPDFARRVAFLAIALLLAALVSHALARALRRTLDATDVPSASIFVNIGRGLVWALAVLSVLQPVFGIEPTAFVTALGVTSLALSLGLQDTISNLIGGLSLMVGRVVKPGDLVDVAKETARLTKERDSVQRDIERGEAKLNNPGFMSKAPAQLVEQEREKLAVSRDKLEKLNARIEDLKNM